MSISATFSIRIIQRIPAYLTAVGAFVVYAFAASLFLCGIAVVLPEVVVLIWKVSGLDDFCDGLHLSSFSRPLLVVMVICCGIR